MIRTRTLAVLLALIATGAVAMQVAAVPGVTAQQQDGPTAQSASFTVDILSAPQSTAPGSTVTVVAEVTNDGAQRGTQPVEFRVGGAVADRSVLTLDPGESQVVTFTADTEGLEPGDYRHGVFTRSNGQTALLVVSESFTIEDFDAPDTVEAGETVTVDVELENPNDFDTTQDVSFWLAGSPVATEDVTIDDEDTEDVTFNVSTEGVPPGTYVHNVFTRDEGEFAEITVEEPGPENASVVMDDQESDGTTVTVDELVLPSDGYVVIHDSSLLDGNVVGSVVGVSEYLEAGEYENVTVTLFDVEGAEFNETELTEDGTFVAMPHNETTGDETYDFVSSDGADDGPFLTDGDPVVDAANVTVAGADENETEAPEDNETEAPAASVTLDDQSSDGTSVVVTDVSVPEGGYVVIHDSSLLDGNVVGSVVGVSEFLEPGEYDEVTVELFDVPGVGFEEPTLTEDQTLVAMPHLETTGDETYDFVTSAGDDDGPYVADGQPVVDAGNVTVANETAG
ncbi:hypothetical protein EGH21_04890 [Halomicroarcula sp. F13]|uniref:CARDB domain-containing protein n=1 Tax=Haloarcula rubra TaxID=2487747 RepID=A0AAW4PP73_9EURY|nr:CARDB domain-containing protein [Halomicroarcula rubra]MBX0322365.1 hypothetical protein [Halomicroarcula rubra]